MSFTEISKKYLYEQAKILRDKEYPHLTKMSKDELIKYLIDKQWTLPDDAPRTTRKKNVEKKEKNKE